MAELREWLRKHKLEQYAEAFKANDIDLDILSELTEHDLEKLGVSLGNRHRLVRRSRSTRKTSPRQHPRPSPSLNRGSPARLSGAKSQFSSAIWSAPRRYRVRSIPSLWAL